MIFFAYSVFLVHWCLFHVCFIQAKWKALPPRSRRTDAPWCTHFSSVIGYLVHTQNISRKMSTTRRVSVSWAPFSLPGQNEHGSKINSLFFYRMHIRLDKTNMDQTSIHCFFYRMHICFWIWNLIDAFYWLLELMFQFQSEQFQLSFDADDMHLIHAVT